MVRKNARLIPTTEKGGLATPLWSDSEFKSLLGVQMNLIVTEKVRQELTKKYEIHPDKTWSVDECKKVLGACIRKNNVKGIICCHREFGLALATQQSQRNSELEEQNKELRARISALTKKLNRNKALEKTYMEVSQPDNIYPDLQAFFEKDVAIQSVTDVPVDSVKVCGARRRSQGIEGIESVPPNSAVVRVQAIAKMLEPKDIERLSQGLPSARTNFCEFRRALISKMRLYDMSLVEVTQLMSQILTESEFNSFESAVTSELRHASKADLREGVLKILKNIMGPKIDWSRITNCVQKKEETVSEYTEKFCQSAVTYSGIVDDPESVLDDKGPLVRIWSDGLVAEYRKALPFLDLTWSNKTLRSNLDTLATWERDSDVKAKVRVAAATFSTTNRDKRWSKKEGKCNYCGKPGHWMKESDPPHYTKLVGQLAEVLTVKAGQTRTHRPVRSPGKNRSATGLGGQPCGEDFLIGFSPHQFVPTSLVCVHAMMSSKAASWSKASPQTPMNKLHKDKESSE
ncbi:UvrABC system protein B [Labeo rohita]|uniref:UvrABC system protein B n=1 Tax=Labeo rohita TaxID=84645 RepID=A0ABQ8L4H8_LABRO|nr:UvrABC system protein B [Labeo rohita]